MRTVLNSLPVGCRGYVIHDPTDDEYTVVLNSKYNHETNIKTCLHEAEHIENNDLDSLLSADTLENIRHK